MQCVHAVKSNLLQVRSFCGSSANRWMLMQQSLLQAVCSLRDSVCHGSLGSAWLSWRCWTVTLLQDNKVPTGSFWYKHSNTPHTYRKGLSVIYIYHSNCQKDRKITRHTSPDDFGLVLRTVFGGCKCETIQLELVEAEAMDAMVRARMTEKFYR